MDTRSSFTRFIGIGIAAVLVISGLNYASEIGDDRFQNSIDKLIHDVKDAQTQNDDIIIDLARLEKEIAEQQDFHRKDNVRQHTFQNCLITEIITLENPDSFSAEALIADCERQALKADPPGANGEIQGGNRSGQPHSG